MKNPTRTPDPPSSGGPALPGAAWGIGTLALAAAAVWLLIRASAVLVMVVGSVLLAALLEPVVAWLSRQRFYGMRLGRRGGAAIAVGTFVILVVVAIYQLAPWLWSQASVLLADLPRYASVAQAKLEALLRDRALLPPQAAGAFQTEIGRLVAEAGRKAAGWLLSLALNVIQLLGYLVIPVGAFYVLSDGARLRRELLGVLPPSWREAGATFLDDAAWALSAYVRGQSAVCATAAVLYGITFEILGLGFAPVLGIVAGISEAIPFLGSLIVVASIAVVGLAQDPALALRVVLGYIIVNQIVNYVITPRFMSKSLDLHPFLVILAVLTGASLAGAGGALLSLPAAAVIQTLLQRSWNPARARPGAAAPPAAASRAPES